MFGDIFVPIGVSEKFNSFVLTDNLFLVGFSVESGTRCRRLQFVVAEDWGCTSNTDATVTDMIGKNPERVFGLGDYSY